MKWIRSGFTLIEVMLFLAVTALLFLGVTLGISGSIFQQRYNDSVQNFADFLRGIYSDTTNVEHNGTGTSEQAIYGKLITFGEKYDLDGKVIGDDEDKIFVYTVVGDIGEIGYGNIASGIANLRAALKTLNVSVVIKNDEGSKLAGIAREYIPRWQAGIQTISAFADGSYNSYKGSILVVRHPSSGNVQTLVSSEVIEVNEALKSGADGTKLLVNKIDSFEFKETDFCVNPFGNADTNQRRDVRLSSNARNASSVNVIDQDSEDNRCNG